ncbi:hypothetical protein ACH5RR_029889 [Cinchona calisaya]|uniref:Reverse transcriptase Ty1/copia-type domain-containing protein n=1 Tax=Cinchona calisaya TaxID=153742 RepID=A0ABD2YU83_9GENT
MQSEFDAFLKNKTWELVPMDISKNVIECKWLFRIKMKPDSSIDRYKARLVAKGFTQRPGIDFHSTFSPVIKPAIVRIVLSLAIQNNWVMHQLDVNNAFLQGYLEEEVFMRQPPDFEHPKLPNHVCRLHKAIYGLKQAPRAWYNELQFLVSLGFHKSHSDTSLFVLHKPGILLYILVYVDDIIVTGNTQTLIHQVLLALSQRFSIKDLGCLTYFLGVEVLRTSNGLILSQTKYIHDILQDCNMHESKGVTTPMSLTVPFQLHDGSLPTDTATYRQVIGKLQHLSFTRPAISFSVNRLSQFMHAPSTLH